jgi:hypothetical protein
MILADLLWQALDNWNVHSFSFNLFYSHRGGGGVESNCVHSASQPPIGLLYLPRVIMTMENLVEWWLAGGTEVLGVNLLQCHIVRHKSHMTWQGAYPGRSGGKPATNRLSYGTAFFQFKYSQ